MFLRTAEYLRNRIELLTHRDPVENAKIINKLTRQLRILDKKNNK